MGRPVTLFTGQWADLTLEEVAMKAAGWGYDGLELACWGDHFEVDKALVDPGYTRSRSDILNRHGLQCWTISTHLVGQCVCDGIDSRHKAILAPDVWGDGDPEGVRRRAAEEMKTTARAAAAFGVDTVVGFTGSAIWHYVAMFPPVADDVIQAQLEQEGIHARVLDMHTIKPIDEEAIEIAATECGAIVCAEEHLLDGGLGSQVRWFPRFSPAVRCSQTYRRDPVT